MKVQVRFRSVVLAALAISLLAFAGFPQNAGAESRRLDAPGQAKKAGEPEPTPAPAAAPAEETKATPSAGTPTAGDEDVVEGYSNHGPNTGPGGQTCDGDPDNADGAGGAYENTCPAGPSQNGAGGGEANGKPCAGCVGNADDKNPAGQADDGPTDHNNGYECDQKGHGPNQGNNGIGYGNPAHTGCQSTPTEPTCPDGKPMPSTGEKDCTPTCPDGKPMPTTGEKDCTPTCPDGKPMPAGGAKDCAPKCPDGSAMPAGGEKDCSPKCPDGKTMPAGGAKDCNPKCPNGDDMPGNGNVDDCVKVTPFTETPGGATAVLGETLARPVDVLGVQLTQPAVAPAALARTGGIQLVGLFQAALALSLLGLGLVVASRHRRSSSMVDIATRLG